MKWFARSHKASATNIQSQYSGWNFSLFLQTTFSAAFDCLRKWMQVRTSEFCFLAVTHPPSSTASLSILLYLHGDINTFLYNVDALKFKYDNIKRTATFSTYKIETIKRLFSSIQCFYWSQTTGQFLHYSPPLLFWLCYRTTQAAFNKNLFSHPGFNFIHKYLNPYCTASIRIAASSHCTSWN